MEPVRGDAEVVENNEQAVLNACPPRTPAEVTTGRRLHRRVEHRDLSRSAQSARKFDVFH
jgi:hypothetical protein